MPVINVGGSKRVALKAKRAFATDAPQGHNCMVELNQTVRYNYIPSCLPPYGFSDYPNIFRERELWTRQLPVGAAAY